MTTHMIFLIGVILSAPALAVQSPVLLPGEQAPIEDAELPAPRPLLVYAQVSFSGAVTTSGGVSASGVGGEEEPGDPEADLTATDEESCGFTDSQSTHTPVAFGQFRVCYGQHPSANIAIATENPDYTP